MHRDFLQLILTRYKLSITKLFILSIFQTICEVLSIFVLITFLISLFSNQSQSNHLDNIFNFEFSKLMFFENNVSITLFMLAFFFLSKNILLILINWLRLDICGKIYKNISSTVYYKILKKEMEFFSNYSTGDFLQNVQGESNFSKEVLVSYIVIFTEFLIILSMFLLLFISQDSKSFVILFSIVAGCLVYVIYLKKYNNILGEKRKINSIRIFNHMLDTLSLLKLIKLKNKNKFFTKKLKTFIARLYKINRNQNVIQQSAHIWLESIIILVLIGLILFLINGKKYSNINISEILFISLITLRFFPSFSTIISSISNINYSKVAVTNTLKFLKQNDFNHEPNTISDEFNFKNIEIKSLYFKYINTNTYIIKNLNTSFKFPSIIGIKGSNGTGKSTLLNIFIGLLRPNKGKIKIDGKDLHNNKSLLFNWKMNIGYVDQKNFFTDDMVSNVIAFGEEEELIDKKKINKCLKAVGLEKIFGSLEDKLGEGGKKFSGGQLQRLNIARALYDDPKIYVFDEITNNLDKKSMTQVISLLRNLKETHLILITSHNDNILNECDSIIDLNLYS